MATPNKSFALALNYAPPRRITRAPGEQVAIGTFLGAFAGILTAVCHDLHDGFLLFLFLTPMLALAGAVAGCVASKSGWRYVAPLPLALLGGVVLPIHDPHGWVIGGALGGALYGAARRSFDRAIRHAAVGTLLGALAWVICLASIAGLAAVFNEPW